MPSQNELGVSGDGRGSGDIAVVQRIDLARFVPKPQKIYLPFNQMLQICVLVLVILFGYSLYGYWQQTTSEKRIAQLRSQSAGLTEKMGSESSKKAQEISSNEAVYPILRIQHASNGAGFSNYLTAFSWRVLAGRG